MVRASGFNDPEFSEINITPFTDVLLVLLVIFMILAALVVPPGFERRIGCGNCVSPVNVTPAHTAQVVITRAGLISVNGTRSSERGLYDTLARIVASDRHIKVQLIADARARYGLIIRVLDAAKAARIRDVSFVTQ